MKLPPHSSSLITLFLFLGACSGIPQASEETHRTELEVAVRVDPSVSALLGQPDDLDSIRRIVSGAILSLADVGLRFYPVLSDSYQESDQRPEYLLTVEIQALRALLDSRVVPASPEVPGVGSSLENLACAAVATFERRRSEGPSLIVKQAHGRGDTSVSEASAVLTSEHAFRLRPGSGESSPTFSAGELDLAVRQAVRNALSMLVEPIDRELAHESPWEDRTNRVR